MKIIRVALLNPDQVRTSELFSDFQEALFGQLLRKPVAQIPDFDSSPRRFHIHITATRHLGTVTTMLRKLLKRHQLTDLVNIERLDRI